MEMNLQFFGGRGSGGGKSAGGGGSNKFSMAGSGSVEEGTRFTKISGITAQRLFDAAPVGTQITLTNHEEGDYIGEMVKVSSSRWEGRQRYKSSYRRPRDVEKASSFATHVEGRDVKIDKIR